MTRLALDTSAAIPLIVQTHRAHAEVVRWWDRREVCLSGHAAVETYAVLTRLPGDMRHTAADAARLLRERFTSTLVLSSHAATRVPEILAELGIAGGGAYDALVALAAVEHDVQLATRDARARATYDAVGASVVVAGA